MDLRFPQLAVFLAAVVAFPASVGAMWTLSEAEPEIDSSAIIVVGRMGDPARELVKYDGGLYSKRCATIRVDEVLLRPQGMQVGSTVRALWGNGIEWRTRTYVFASRSGRGAWLLSLDKATESFYVIGPEGWFFVPESELPGFVSSLSEKAPCSAEIVRSNRAYLLRVRYANFGDSPRELPLWTVKDGELRLPQPYELVVSRWTTDDGEDRRVVLARSGVLSAEDAEPLTVPARSYIEREIDVTAWLSAPLSQTEWPWCHLKIGGKVAAFISIPDEPPEGEPEASDYRPMHIMGDWGTPVWWYPSSRRVMWLALVGGPILIALAIRFWRKGRRRACYALCGVFLGCVSTWILLAYGPDAVIDAIPTEMRYVLFGGTFTLFPAALLVMALLVAPYVLCRLAIRSRKLTFSWKNALVVWAFWLGMPAAVAATVALVEGMGALA